MKKPFRIIALLLIACMSFMFAGCDLFTRNNVAYYNQIVITATYKDGSKIEINRKDYLTAYYNYGSTLINSYGYTEEKAQEATVDALINRKILLKEAKRLAGTEEGASIELTTAEKKELLYQTYSSLMSNAREYESDIRDALNMPEPDTMEQETTTTAVKYEKYEKQARPVYVADESGESGEYKILLLEDNETPKRDIEFADQNAIYEAFIAETKNNQSDVIAREEYRKYLASLQSSQKLLGTNYNEEQLIKEEIKRIYTNLEENEYITKYQEYKQDNNGYSYITVNQVLEKYKAMITSAKFIYDNDLSSYNDDILSDVSKVDYFVNDDYFYVAHILIKFDDEQSAKYEELETLSNNGQGYIISAQNYEKQKTALYADLKANVRDLETGEIVENRSVSASDVLKEVQVALRNATTKEQKDEAFRQLMYKYNEDDGIMNATYPYVVGTENSQMVESFTDASRELNTAGTYGEISGLVESEYGVHIIYYMGKCTNAFEFGMDGSIELRANYTIDDGTGASVPTSDILKLDETYLNNLNNKTLFDLIYEELATDNYSQFENMDLSTLKDTNGIEITKVDKLI